MNQAQLEQLLGQLKATPAMQSKMNIAKGLAVHPTKIESLADLYALPGDDTAATLTSHGYLLHACEGMIPSFVEHHPYFAGWSAVMANVSDIAAMGGRATSIVNSFWHQSTEQAQALIQGMQDACECYGVPLVGGHTHIDPSFQPALSVAIQGQAEQLLSVMHVKAKQNILLVLNLNGHFHPNSTYWKCFEGAAKEKLRAELEILPQLAEQGLVYAARDISNAGILGSLLMLLEATGYGADINLENIIKPEAVEWQDWLQIFPSYGFLLSADQADSDEVIAQFAQHDLHCVVVGQVNTTTQVNIRAEQAQATFWDFKKQAFTGLCYKEQIQALKQYAYQFRYGELKLCQA